MKLPMRIRVKPGEKRSQRVPDDKGMPREQPAYHAWLLQSMPSAIAPPITPALHDRAYWPPMPGRIPRIIYPNLVMLAGLHSSDAVNQTDHGAYLPPLDVMHRGADIRAVAGGANWIGGGSMQAGSARIPAVYVPVGRR